MGMDVSSKAPTSEAGEYFRNNIWCWRPLAEFLTDTYPELTYRCEYRHTNDGDGLDAEGSTALAHALTRDLDNGTVDAYAANRGRSPRLAAPAGVLALPRHRSPHRRDRAPARPRQGPAAATAARAPARPLTRPPSTPSPSRTCATSPHS